MPTKIVRIFSENDNFQLINSLKINRSRRQKQREFLLEGVNNINSAINNKWHIKGFIYSTEIKQSSWTTGLIKNIKVDTHYQTGEAVFKRLRENESSELLAIVEIPDDSFSRIPVEDNFLVVVFDRPSDTENLGGLINVSQALGAQGMIITGYATDIYDKNTIDSSLGSLFSLPIARYPSHSEILPWLEKIKKQLPDLQIVGADQKSETSLNSVDFKKPTILVVGSEKFGLSLPYRELINKLIKIPTKNNESVLNIASANSIVLYEIARQRKQ